jgi:DNA primase catalytic core
MTPFRAFIEEVRRRSDIVEVIGADVALRPRGKVWKGLSPFNPETDPSFVVWPETQSWHDFSRGGGRGGDVFRYIQERDRCGFKEALGQLAERAGLRRPGQDDTEHARELALLVERREVRRLLTLAAARYHRVLPAKIREEWYRAHYGFTDETIDRLLLGWADGHLYEELASEPGVTRALALKTGLFVAAGPHVHDFFRDRLVFPYWKRGEVVYFIARATPYTADEPWEQAKYKKLLTHSERHPYVSPAAGNDHFYNEDAGRGAEELLITEGVTDCISAMQAGIACISPVTTRFRERDVPKLLALTHGTRRIVICNDAEASGAGEAGALHTAAALHREGRDVRIAILPRPDGVEKIDVNEFLKAHSADELRAVLGAAPRYVDHLIARIPPDTSPVDLVSMRSCSRRRSAAPARSSTGPATTPATQSGSSFRTASPSRRSPRAPRTTPSRLRARSSSTSCSWTSRSWMPPTARTCSPRCCSPSRAGSSPAARPSTSSRHPSRAPARVSS